MTRFASVGASLLGLALVLGGHGRSHVLLAQQQASTTIGGLEAIQIRPNVYVMYGAGANVTVQVGGDALVLADGGSGDRAAELLPALRVISPRPIRLIINTSADPDHVGGNAILGGAGGPISPDPFALESHATLLAHENVLRRMSAPTGSPSLFPSSMWPTETFTSRFRPVFINDDSVQVVRQTGAHSDSDIMVLFRKADVMVYPEYRKILKTVYTPPASCGRYCCGWVERQGLPGAAPDLTCKDHNQPPPIPEPQIR
jgi:hypothetical protein